MEHSEYIGKLLDGRYYIETIIGSGGMATVFRATDQLMNRIVAIKMLRDEFANDAASVKRFINESRAVAMLSHENIVNIYDVSVSDESKYIVMEYIEGITLKNYVANKGALEAGEVISCAEQILCALEHAHSKGVIHRDIKPQNIMLLKNGQIKVADFGIAKLPSAETVTVSDKAIGTVYYISPEQASGKKVDARSDLYSLGALLYEISTGQLPFDNENTVSIALMQINDNPSPPREVNPNIPVGLQEIILTAMEKDPDMRFQSASQMLSCIQKLKTNPNSLIRKKDLKGVKPRSAKSGTSWFPIILGVVSSFAIAAIVSGIYLFNILFIKGSVDKSQTVTIPSLVGNYYHDGILDTNLYKVTLVKEYNSEYEANVITEQNPAAGEVRKVIPGIQKASVKLTVSLGVEEIVMKNYTMVGKYIAEISLREDKFTTDIKELYNDSIPEGYVISTEPKAGTLAPVGSTVIIYVSKGPEIKYTTVPSLVGKDEISAWNALSEAGLSKRLSVSYIKSNLAAGTVIEQSIAAGTQVPSDLTKIELVISGGPNWGN